MLGSPPKNTCRLTGGILSPEMMVLTRVRATTTTLPDRFGEDVGGLYGPIPVVIYPPSVRPVPNHAIPFEIDYDTPTDEEIEAVVRSLRRNMSDIHTHLRTEHLKVWLREAYSEKNSTPPTNLPIQPNS